MFRAVTWRPRGKSRSIFLTGGVTRYSLRISLSSIVEGEVLSFLGESQLLGKRDGGMSTYHPVFWVSMGRVSSIFCASEGNVSLSTSDLGTVHLPRSLIFQTPAAAVEDVRLWPFLSLRTSFSVGSGALSSIDKPAMAESTLVSGADMVR